MTPQREFATRTADSREASPRPSAAELIAIGETAIGTWKVADRDCMLFPH